HDPPGVLGVAQCSFVVRSSRCDPRAEIPHASIRVLRKRERLDHPLSCRSRASCRARIEHRDEPLDPEVDRLEKLSAFCGVDLVPHRNIAKEEGRKLRPDTSNRPKLPPRVRHIISFEHPPRPLHDVERTDITTQHADGTVTPLRLSMVQWV